MMVLWCSDIQAREWSRDEVANETIIVSLIILDLETMRKGMRLDHDPILWAKHNNP
jgi:hypothetical protein